MVRERKSEKKVEQRGERGGEEELDTRTAGQRRNRILEAILIQNTKKTLL